jgi:hypothetical protein
MGYPVSLLHLVTTAHLTGSNAAVNPVPGGWLAWVQHGAGTSWTGIGRFGPHLVAVHHERDDRTPLTLHCHSLAAQFPADPATAVVELCDPDGTVVATTHQVLR